MHVPVMTFAELRDKHLAPHGYKIETPQQQDFWSEHDRVIVRKDDYSFPLQFREKYFYLQIVILFRQLGIPIPEDHQTCYDQHMEHRKKMIQKAKAEAEAKKNKEGDH